MDNGNGNHTNYEGSCDSRIIGFEEGRGGGDCERAHFAVQMFEIASIAKKLTVRSLAARD